jgi:hypothetical protein
VFLYNVIPYDQETEIINLELRIMFMTGRLYIYLYIVMAAVRCQCRYMTQGRVSSICLRDVSEWALLMLACTCIYTCILRLQQLLATRQWMKHDHRKTSNKKKKYDV